MSRVDSRCYNKHTGEEQTDSRFYLCSMASAERLHHVIRHHWHVENRLHWVFDVTFGEDGSRKIDWQSAQNFSLITRTVLNLIGSRGEKGSIKGAVQKRLLMFNSAKS